MGTRNAFRWLLAILVVLCVVALLAWRRNDPGVGGRVPDESAPVERVAPDYVPISAELGVT